MQHGNRYKCGDVKPNRHIHVSLPALDDRSDHVPPEYNPDNGDSNIDWPFKFGVFL